MSGVKHDNGKPPLSLIPRDALEGAARVLAFGREKYGADNWRGGFAWRRLLDAALRHTNAFADGEDVDPETGLSHIDHALCCLLFLSTHVKRGLGTDDRFRAPEQAAAKAPDRVACDVNGCAGRHPVCGRLLTGHEGPGAAVCLKPAGHGSPCDWMLP